MASIAATAAASYPATGVPDKTATGYPAQPSQIAAGYPTTAVSYPYAAPPPATYAHQAYGYGQPVGRPTPAYSQGQFWGPNFLCRVLKMMAIVFASIALFFFIFWLVLKPRFPEFRVESAAVSSLNVSGPQLTATWDFTLVVRNRNHKLRIYYDSIEALVFYGDDFELATTRLPPFLQDTKNETRLKFQASVVSEYLKEDVSKGISSGRDSGSVNFGVRVLSWIQFRFGVWRTRQHLLRVYCEPLKFGFSSPNNITGALLDQPKACTVIL